MTGHDAAALAREIKEDLDRIYKWTLKWRMKINYKAYNHQTYQRTDNRLILLYKGLKGKARIPTDDLIPKTRRCRNSHSKAFQLPSASIEAYKCSFFPQTIRDWNDLPDSLFSTAEMSDDCVSKFASLVHSRD